MGGEAKDERLGNNDSRNYTSGKVMAVIAIVVLIFYRIVCH